MKKIVYGILATLSGLVLLFSYRTSLGETSAPVAQIGSNTTTTGAAGTTTSGSAPSASAAAPGTAASSSSSSSSASSSSGSAAASSGLKDGTYKGKPANTRYGAVQVQITVSGGKITDVS
ncbi:MAG: FMN-binding protein, partial [Actinobacteria bacterium]|nr:FMN-binding protein [Actinomycetota bacterium]